MQTEEYTMAPMLKKEMAQINWEEKSALEIKNLVRGLNPIMGAYTFLNGKKIKFWKVQSLEDNEFLEVYEPMKEYSYKLPQITAGTILISDEKQGLYIKAKNGIIKVLEIQAENAKKMNISDFLRGNRLEAGSILE